MERVVKLMQCGGIEVGMGLQRGGVKQSCGVGVDG